MREREGREKGEPPTTLSGYATEGRDKGTGMVEGRRERGGRERIGGRRELKEGENWGAAASSL